MTPPSVVFWLPGCGITYSVFWGKPISAVIECSPDNLKNALFN